MSAAGGGANLGTARGRVVVETSDLRKAELALKQTGLAFLGIGTLAAAGVGLAIKAAANFEKEISHFKAVTASSADEIELVRQKALQLGRDSAYGAGQAAQAFVELGKAGISAKEILAGVGDAVVTLAAAGDIPLAESATTIVNILRTFNLEAKDSVHVANELAGAANASTIEIDDLATSFKYAGSVAAAIGISFEDTAAALAELGNAGIRGSTGGTSLRRILLQLSPQTAKARAELKELGIVTKNGANQFFDAAGKAKPLADIFQLLADRTAGLTQEQKVQAISTIFGARAVSSALILMRGGAQGLNDMQKQIGKTTALDVMKTRLDNLSGALKIFKSSIETAFITAGSPVQDQLKKFVQSMTEMVNKFAALPPETQKNIIKFAALTSAVFLAAGAFTYAIGSIFKFVRIIQEISNVVKIITSLKAIQGAMTALNATFLTNPVFLAIAGLIALGAAVFLAYKHFPVFHRFVDMVWQKLQQFWDIVVKVAKVVGRDLVGAFEAASRFIGKIVKAFQALTGDDGVQGFAEIMDNAFGNSGKFVAVFRVIGQVITNVAQIVSVVFNAIKNTISNFIQFVTGFINIIRGIFTGNWSLVWKGIQQVVGAVWDQIKNIVSTAIAFLRTNIGQWVIDVLQKLGELSVRGLEAVGRFFGSLPERLAGWLGEAIGFIIGFTLRCIDQAEELGVQFGLKLASFFVKLPGRITQWLIDTLPGVIRWIAQMELKAIELGQRFLGAVGEFLLKLPGRVFELLKLVIPKIVDFGIDAFNEALKIGGKIVDAIESGIRRLPGLVGDILDEVIEVFKALIKKAFNIAKSFAEGLWKGFKKGLGIGSPSLIERAMWMMRDNVLGSVKDITKAFYGLNKAMPNFKSKIEWGTTNTLTTAAAAGLPRLNLPRDLPSQILDLWGGTGSVRKSQLPDPVTINIDASGNGSPEAVVEALFDSKVLAQIVRAARAGRR